MRFIRMGNWDPWGGKSCSGQDKVEEGKGSETEVASNHFEYETGEEIELGLKDVIEKGAK